MDTAWSNKVRQWWEQAANTEGERWARPAAPILHELEDEKAEPHVFFTNTNYRISRKYINIEKVKVGVMVCAHADDAVRICTCRHTRVHQG